jgi:hypothetical protein
VCLETDNLSVSVSPTGKRRTVTITKIMYTGTTGKAIPNPYPADSQAVGDAFYLQFVAPHLTKKTIIHSSLPAIDQTGNPYWRGNGLAASLRNLCGA